MKSFVPMNGKTALFLLFLSLSPVLLYAQHSQAYVPETDSLVLQKLERWQDLKFGLLMHWGPYSQWGVVESWSICGEDEDWCRRKTDDYHSYVQAYESLKTTFNPVQFDPDLWARAARDAGMRYVVFTTKHHDGFCMFDTRFTDYRITDPGCPFHTNPRSNIAREIFEAFRKQGLWTGAYFSKPDWHCGDYWWRNFPTPDRNVNYDIARYPDRWERYVRFTHGQIGELMKDYGEMDILWLDGGWVQKRTREDILKDITGPNYKFTREQSQDIRMDELVAQVRALQPGLIVVDRAVPGKNQNYLTPENMVPGELLPYPWESCIISGGSWSWIPDAKYMSPREVVHLLSDIVSKGGNLLLNIAPGPDGTWDQGAYAMLSGVGKWMKGNGEAIYGTRPVLPYRQGQVCYTAAKDGTSVYAIYLVGKEEVKLPAEIDIFLEAPARAKKVELLGYPGRVVWKKNKSGIKVLPDPAAQEEWSSRIALVYKVVLD